LPFVARSVVLVNIEKSVRLSTNLIVGDDLLQIFEKPEHIFIVLNVVSKPSQPWPPPQRL
jgi:hypothetical protein